MLIQVAIVPWLENSRIKYKHGLITVFFILNASTKESNRLRVKMIIIQKLRFKNIVVALQPKIS